MKTHLSDNDILEMAFDKLNLANPNVDKIIEIAELMDLDYNESENAYHNPDCCNCEKELNKIDLEFGKKSHPYLCANCFTGNG